MKQDQWRWKEIGWEKQRRKEFIRVWKNLPNRSARLPFFGTTFGVGILFFWPYIGALFIKMTVAEITASGTAVAAFRALHEGRVKIVADLFLYNRRDIWRYNSRTYSSCTFADLDFGHLPVEGSLVFMVNVRRFVYGHFLRSSRGCRAIVCVWIQTVCQTERVDDFSGKFCVGF